MNPASFLERLPAPVRQALLAIARPQRFAPGSTLIRFGQPARAAYLVHAGTAQVLRTMPGGETLPIAELGPGAVVGEMALIEQGVCSATVVAATEVQASVVEGDAFRALVARPGSEASQLQQALSDILVARVREIERRIAACIGPEARAAPEAPGDGAAPSAPAFDLAPFLPRLAFFRAFEADELAALLRPTEAGALPRHQRLCRPGEAASACWVVVRGAVEVRLPVAGREHRLAIVGPGHLVGFVDLLEGCARSYGILSREPAVLLRWPAAGFLGLLHGDSPLAGKLQRKVHWSLMQSIARLNTQLTCLASESGPGGSGAAANPLTGDAAR